MPRRGVSSIPMPVDHSHYPTAALGKRVKELFCIFSTAIVTSNKTHSNNNCFQKCIFLFTHVCISFHMYVCLYIVTMRMQWATAACVCVCVFFYVPMHKCMTVFMYVSLYL